MNRDTLQKQLSEKIVEQRLAKAKSAADSAELHGLDTYWGRVYLDESYQWHLAAEKAKAGDLTPLLKHKMNLG